MVKKPPSTPRSRSAPSRDDRSTGRTTPTRRRGTRAETRRRLIEAAIELIREEGAERLTTVNVAAGAGIVQSGFYMHFKNIDDCKRVAAQQLAAEVREFVADYRRRTREQGDDNPEAIHEQYQATLQLFLFERRFAELLLRCRHDPSPLGEVIRELNDQIRQDLIDDLRELVSRVSPGTVTDRRLAIYADITMGMVMALGEGLLEGRHDDPEPLARELTLASIAMARAVFDNSSG